MEVTVYVAVTHDNCFLGVFGTPQEASNALSSSPPLVMEERVELPAGQPLDTGD